MAVPTTERDSLDFRDLIYRPSLAKPRVALWPKRSALYIRDQGDEGACTGFGLAAVIDYVGGLRGKRVVSARMLYEMAKRHDRWPGIDYEGSTARATMKGWHKNGVCTETLWPYARTNAGHLTRARAEAALECPLGAYYRILPRRSDVHAALGETGAIFCSARVHDGWDEPEGGRIRWKSSPGEDGAGDVDASGHAFAIVGYTSEGFIVQNSWGKDWGGLVHRKQRFPGLAIWSYPDFDHNVWDLWVARHARPVESLEALATGWLREGNAGTEPAVKAPAQIEIRDCYVHIDDGEFENRGDYPSSVASVHESIRAALSGSSAQRPKHIALYAHGGLNGLKAAARRVRAMQPVFEANRIRAIHFLWETGFLEELRDVLFGRRAEAERRAGGFSDWWDRCLETATGWAGRALWSEMAEDARLAFDDGRAGTTTIELLAAELALIPAAKRPQLHLIGHSAGSIWFGHFLARAARHEVLRFGQLVLFAPACTIDLFASHIRPALLDGRVRSMELYRLDDRRELDDNVGTIYRKSLLYLVSRAYQQKGRVVPLLGLEKYRSEIPLTGIEDRVGQYDPKRDPSRTRANHHGDFDNDVATMNATMRAILDSEPIRPFEESDLDF
ncbi:MAG: C1 family peptidase [Planctomycetes bacterium]|nr:C1 family peptidase [Planctomycetota bacterium]MCB9916991.1 C1 family peptidase [Planctomycetota bacterium]